jgi:CheY-like chemotaxis protein
MARVLVIEDEATIALILSEVLREQGHEAVTVSGGAAGLDWLRESPPPDVVLLDLFMPGLGGRDVLKAMRSDPRLKDVPVVLVTGAVPSVEDFPPNGTYQALITKPFDLSDITETIDACLRRR